jgi:hypothetical protein
MKEQQAQEYGLTNRLPTESLWIIMPYLPRYRRARTGAISAQNTRPRVVSYRFYSIKKDGHIGSPAAQHDLPDDAAALQTAKQLLSDADIEIWQGTRVVGYLKAAHDANKDEPAPVIFRP